MKHCMKHCIVKFKSTGEKSHYKTSFDGLEVDEEVVVELVIDGALRLSRARFVEYLEDSEIKFEDLHSVVGRWIKNSPPRV